ncbi:MAG: hypothetical protein FWD56_04365 [Bacteroidales bacterium]|nr:hypothetical protein [Bacteroidales bacterium]
MKKIAVRLKKFIMSRVCLVLWTVAVCSSCSTSKFINPNINPIEINWMLKIEPFSYISLIETGNKSTYNEVISSSTKMILNESVEAFRVRLRLSSKEIRLTDSFEKNQLEQELNFLIMSAEQNRSKNNIPITPLISSLLSKNDARFGLIIVQSGFTRVKGNYGGQVAMAIGIGIATGLLTGVAFTPMPEKAESTLHAMIVDNQNKNVVFYNKSVLKGKEPTEKTNIIKQIDKVFEKYYWVKR